MPIFAGRAVTAFGTGVVGPYLVIYLWEVRGFSIVSATAAASITSVMAVLGGLAGGWSLDMFGWRSVTMTVFLVTAVGTGSYAFASSFPVVLLAATLFGLGIGAGGGLWPTLIARTAPPALRGRAFGLDYLVFNAGLGVGGLAGGIIVAYGGDDAFRLLFIGDALSFLICAAVLVSFVRPGVDDADASSPSPHSAQRATSVLADRRALGLLALIVGLGAIGYGQFESIMPAFVTGHSSVPVSWMSVVYAANTVTIVACGILFARHLDRLGHRTGFLLTAICWCLSWILISILPSASHAYALATVVAASVTFGAGELFLARALPGAINVLASASNRGRYNGAASVALNFGRTIGPFTSGAVMNSGAAGGLFPALATASLVTAFAARRLVPVEAGQNRSLHDQIRRQHQTDDKKEGIQRHAKNNGQLGTDLRT